MPDCRRQIQSDEPWWLKEIKDNIDALQELLKKDRPKGANDGENY